APAELLHIINDSAPRIFFFEAQYLDVIASLRAQLASVEHFVCIGGSAPWAQDYKDFVAAAADAPLTLRAREEDILCLIYTSGTTGRPKGCIWGHREFRQLVLTTAWMYGVQE